MALTLVMIMALSFMVGILFWRGRGEQALIHTALSSAEDRFTRVTITNILWQEGLRQMKEQGFFPSPLSLYVKTTLRLKATLTLSAEASRLNLNQATEEDLFYFFLDHHLSEKEARIMTDSLLDWRDADDLHRLNGAEKDYYRPKGYEPRNSPLKDFSEATLIRGFDPYRFWFNPGLYRWVTIYGGNQSPLLSEATSPGIRLQNGQVYRLELTLTQGKKKLRYLEIFKYKDSRREQLFAFSW